MAAASARVNPEATWRIYDALATDAGVSEPVTVEDPRVWRPSWAVETAASSSG